MKIIQLNIDLNVYIICYLSQYDNQVKRYYNTCTIYVLPEENKLRFFTNYEIIVDRHLLLNGDAA